MGNDNEEYSKLLITILFSSLMKKNYCTKLKIIYLILLIRSKSHENPLK